ncbi:MAG: TIGR01620 family protein [Xanthobacteraceae bacterium]|nr:TIGR01620 family protein [Xanthobacteraceae bacterium]QYK45979.1 MAG: TIGR01620 family protein [Xanthobacteraceae bacterium]
MSAQPSKPAAFRADDPRVTVAPAEPVFTREELRELETDAENLPAVVESAPPRRRFWGKLFWTAASGLVSLAFGLAVTNLIQSMFAVAPWLGWLAAGLTALALLALLVIATRELWAVFRLAKIEHLQKRAAEVLASDNRDEGRAVVGELLSLTRAMPALARARTSVEGYTGEIIDGADLVRLAEREMMSGLDAQARVLVSSAAKRVSLVTAISPRAAVDMIFVFANTIFLIRKLATLYGGRPGLLGMLRLMRHVVSHLALTGGMAIGDSIVQQVLGQGLAAKLSARLGEGVLNGLLTARLGIAAIEVTRPLPFAALPRPKLSDLAGNLLPKKGE